MQTLDISIWTLRKQNSTTKSSELPHELITHGTSQRIKQSILLFAIIPILINCIYRILYNMADVLQFFVFLILSK